MNWQIVSGFFIPDSAYEFLSIGNFFVDSLTSYIAFDSAASAAYYFIDDVTLLDSIPLGINEPSKASIRIYPNPANNSVS
jgi:hypothetical protein